MAGDNFMMIIDKDGQPHWRYKGIDGNLLKALRDGERMRVSLADAEEVRDERPARHQLSEADRLVLADAEYRRKTAGSRPGFRTMPNDP